MLYRPGGGLAHRRRDLGRPAAREHHPGRAHALRGPADRADVLRVLDLVERDDQRIRLAEQRRSARAERDFAESDRLRDEIRARGWEVRDTPGGFELARTSPQ